MKKEVMEAKGMTMNGNLKKPTRIFSELTPQLFLQDISSKLLMKNNSNLVNSSPLIESSEMRLLITLIWQNSIRLKVL